MKLPNEILNKDEYYHGTFPVSAFMIMQEGFKIGKGWCRFGRDGTFGSAIYLTKSLKTAALFGRYILKCKLKNGLRLLHLNKEYDTKIISYLKKEFGKSILTGDITKAMSSNKHLTNKELIALLNYRYAQMGDWKDIHKWNNSVYSFRQQLQRNKYDGIGEVVDETGVAIFNPSHVNVVEICFYHDYQRIVKFDKRFFFRDLQEELKFMKKEFRPEEYESFEKMLIKEQNRQGII